MTRLSDGQVEATNIIGRLLASYDLTDGADSAGIDVDIDSPGGSTVTATISLPSGERFRVEVEWLGELVEERSSIYRGIE